MGYIAGIGGANVDIHGRADAPLVMRDSNPGTLHLSMGGVMRNILDNAARLGSSVKLASVVGDDPYGRMLREGCASLGMDTGYLRVRPGHHSSSYISVLDDDGDMIVAMSDMHIVKELNGDFVAECLPMLNGADLVVCDGNLSPAALEALARLCTRPLYMDPVSTSWARQTEPYLGAFDTIKPNRQEMEVLAGMPIHTEAELDAACDAVLARGVRQVFVSLGRDGLYYKGPEGTLHGRCHGFDGCVNATGAGDATMAGIVRANQLGCSALQTMRIALGAGLVAISCDDTINPAMSMEAIEHMIKEYVE